MNHHHFRGLRDAHTYKHDNGMATVHFYSDTATVSFEMPEAAADAIADAFKAAMASKKDAAA